MSGWEPIKDAPVPAWDSPEARPSYFTWQCLLQLPTNHPDAEPWITSGEAYYVAAPRSTERRILRWRDGHGRQCFPKYWMPLPAPRKD